MFTLTKKADYGMAMLSILARGGRGKRVSINDLAKMGMPRAFVAKIAKSLVLAGILNSKEGKGGGFSLNYQPKEIQVKEALEAIEGSVVAPVTCAGCPIDGGCGQQGFMNRLSKEIEKILEKYTLEDLIK